MGDAMRESSGNIIILHITYFLIVTIAMLNIIFGIIIDTFSSLRAQKNERDRDTTEVCFICGQSKQKFDRAANSPDGFKNHIKNDHNMWSYLAFVFFVWKQDKDDDDGLEYYVRHRIAKNEITWFPINKAMRLDDRESDIDALKKAILEDMHATERSVFDRMAAIQTDIDGFLDKFTSALQQDFSNTTVKLGISGFLKGMDEFQDAAPTLEMPSTTTAPGGEGEGENSAEDEESAAAEVPQVVETGESAAAGGGGASAGGVGGATATAAAPNPSPQDDDAVSLISALSTEDVKDL